jgi:preprotein translocase subunit SecG
VREVFRQLLTGRDNTTHDVVRWLAVLSILVALGLAIYVVVWRGQPFDLQSYGVGIGAVFLAVGGALNLKKDTEPS